MRFTVVSIFLALYLLLCSNYAVAQNDLNCNDSFCSPGVYGMPRSKGLEIKLASLADFAINSTAQKPGINSGKDEVRNNRRAEFKLKIPVLNRERNKFAMGFHYSHEQFTFENRELPLYQSLEDKSLRSLGTSLYYVRSYNRKSFLILRSGFSLNGDYSSDNTQTERFLKMSFTPVWGRKVHDFLSYGVGLSYNYNFGSPSLYPVLAYNHTFNPKWGLEAILPVKLRTRHNLSSKDILYVTAELNGLSYSISLPQDSGFKQYNTVELRQSELKYFIDYEREIHDYLWFGVQAGLRQNVNFNISKSNTIINEYLLKSKVGLAPYFNVSLFLVPPRKFVE